jgi:hypothetical protein
MVDLDELKEAAQASLPILTARRKALEESLIGASLDDRRPLQREIDKLLVEEFLVKRIQRDIEASENPIGAIDPAVKFRLDTLADRLDVAIIRNAKINAILETAIAFADALKGIQGASA